MWIISILPSFVLHLILVAGILGTLAGFVLGFIPVINTYKLPIQIISILLLSVGLYLEGGLADQVIWQLKVKEVEAKVAQAEAKGQAANVEIVTQLVTKTKIIHDRGQDIIKYIDKEVLVDKEVVKFIENCSIPDIIIKTLNAAALNKPIEISNPAETAPIEPVKAEPAAPKEQPKEKTVSATVKKWSNIRETTDHASKKLDKLSPGDKVDVIKLDNNYALVKHNTTQGWISKAFISITGDKI